MISSLVKRLKAARLPWLSQRLRRWGLTSPWIVQRCADQARRPRRSSGAWRSGLTGPATRVGSGRHLRDGLQILQQRSQTAVVLQLPLARHVAQPPVFGHRAGLRPAQRAGPARQENAPEAANSRSPIRFQSHAGAAAASEP